MTQRDEMYEKWELRLERTLEDGTMLCATAIWGRKWFNLWVTAPGKRWLGEGNLMLGFPVVYHDPQTQAPLRPGVHGHDIRERVDRLLNEWVQNREVLLQRLAHFETVDAAAIALELRPMREEFWALRERRLALRRELKRAEASQFRELNGQYGRLCKQYRKSQISLELAIRERVGRILEPGTPGIDFDAACTLVRSLL